MVQVTPYPSLSLSLSAKDSFLSLSSELDAGRCLSSRGKLPSLKNVGSLSALGRARRMERNWGQSWEKGKENAKDRLPSYLQVKVRRNG